MHDRIVAEIDLTAIRHNVGVIKEIVGPRVQVMAIVKADGYGHGAVEVARAALEAGATWLGIATVSEGIELRRAFPNVPIGHLPPYTLDGCDEVVEHTLTPFVSEVEGLKRLQNAASRQSKSTDFHLEIDTGMGRSGVAPHRALELANGAAGMSHVRLTGLATHFAAAESDRSFTEQQIATFDSAVSDIRASHAVKLVHAANSPAILLYPGARYDMVRPGLLIYGILPEMPNLLDIPPLRPALTLKTQIALVRMLEAGQSISYSRTHVLNRTSRIATLPVGYGDGYPRGLSNVGKVLVCGRRASIVGRVCMDVTMVDVTDIPEAQVGSEVVLIGRQGEREIRVEEIARHVRTTEHDVTTRLTARVPRVYRDSGAE